MTKATFLKTDRQRIVDEAGQDVALRGVNVGGWLNWEGYFFHGPNRAATLLRKAFIRQHGREEFLRFVEAFRKSFISESDFKIIAGWGMNCVRVPFHYRVVESAPYRYDRPDMRWLDRAIRWAGQHGLRVILDLHAAPGSQNHDWHSDSLGPARLWTNRSYRHRTYAIWEHVADRYRNNPTVAGYDLLNEAVLSDAGQLNAFYQELIRRIRSVDRRHILFVEGNRWAQDLACLDEFEDGNYALSIHNYEPLNFTFNFRPHMCYPLKGKQGGWNRATTMRHLKKYVAIARRHQAPVFVGEFGVNYRQGLYGEDKWLDDVLHCFQELGFHWTYWTYKAVKNNAFPDGLYSYYENPPWVHREGPEEGWETFPRCWTDHSRAMISSWNTAQHQLNSAVVDVLKTYGRQNQQSS